MRKFILLGMAAAFLFAMALTSCNTDKIEAELPQTRAAAYGILPSEFTEIKNGATVTLTWNGPTNPAGTWTITPSAMEGGRAEILNQTSSILTAKFFNTKTNVSGSFSIKYIYNKQAYYKTVYIEQQPGKPDPIDPGSDLPGWIVPPAEPNDTWE